MPTGTLLAPSGERKEESTEDFPPFICPMMLMMGQRDSFWATPWMATSLSISPERAPLPVFTRDSLIDRTRPRGGSIWTVTRQGT